MARHFNFFRLFVLLLLLPADGYAPCVVFTPPEQQLNGTGQRAFIAYNPQTQQVDLVPSINISGEATEFGIVIPTPAIPKLDTVDQRIFRELNDLTMPVTRWRGGGGSSGCNVFTTEESGVAVFDSAVEEEGVTVISEETVGAFDTVILTADDPMALIDWLDEHGYHHSIDDNAILQGYIDQKWIFTAMRLNVAQFEGGERRPARFFDATIDPILMTYRAEKSFVTTGAILAVLA